MKWSSLSTSLIAKGNTDDLQRTITAAEIEQVQDKQTQAGPPGAMTPPETAGPGSEMRV